jgi:hypothetical protein
MSMAGNPETRDLAGPYVYQPLDPRKHQIRLLEPSRTEGSTADYRLVIFDYETAPRYAALSYTWGNEKLTEAVFIDNNFLKIPQGLSRFLSTYREHTYLWIDQISINQSDIQERNHQVSLMSKIYMRCDFVLVWLRDESRDTPSTHQAALDFNKGIQCYDQHTCNRGSKADAQIINRPILALMRNPYFDRLWIVQELLLARNIRILVEGNTWISWKSLRNACKTWSSELRASVPGTVWMVESHIFRFAFASHTPKSLSYYLTLTVGKFCQKNCRDPRDKVYGLMSLVRPASKITIDYNMCLEGLYLQTFMTLVREYGDMTYDVPNGIDGYEFLRVQWDIETAKEASWGLAQEMFKEEIQRKAGLKTLVDAVWSRVQTFETTKRCPRHKADFVHHCIPSMGFQLRTQCLCNALRRADRTRTVLHDRWWYEFEGWRYYHDCREQTSDSSREPEEYTELLKGACCKGLIVYSAIQDL